MIPDLGGDTTSGGSSRASSPAAPWPARSSRIGQGLHLHRIAPRARSRHLRREGGASLNSLRPRRRQLQRLLARLTMVLLMAVAYYSAPWASITASASAESCWPAARSSPSAWSPSDSSAWARSPSPSIPTARHRQRPIGLRTLADRNVPNIKAELKKDFNIRRQFRARQGECSKKTTARATPSKPPPSPCSSAPPSSAPPP
jgi:hypothetical protein